MIFDGIPTGSPVTANQLNELYNEIERVLIECPSTASYTYLGTQGVLATGSKTEIEFQTAIAVPVPTVESYRDCTCHVLLSPILFDTTAERQITADVLSWELRWRGADGTVGTYSTQTVPTQWASSFAAPKMGDWTNEIDCPITVGQSATNKFPGAFVALRLAGTWGYSGNLPHFMAFIS